MSTTEWIAAASLLLSVIAVFISAFSARRANLANDVSMGQAENELRNSIRTTKSRVEDIGLQMASLLDGKRPDQLNAQERRHFGVLDKIFRSAVEENLNAYENACAKYRDRKIDRKRFKQTYYTEVRKLCEPPLDGSPSAIKDLMHPADTSSFQAIWMVFREWHHRENA
jgi:hypothetical protein